MRTTLSFGARCVRAAVIGLAAALFLPAGARLSLAQSPPARTVIDNERGFYYAFAYKDDWAGIGAVVGLPHREFYALMRPEAIKLPHGHLQHFASDDPQDAFPYKKMAAYDAAEIAAGKPSLFVSATYQGKKRPVYFPWNLELGKQKRPRAPRGMWQRPVNLRDERFIRFFIHSYVRESLWQPKYQNMWMGVDQCSFRYDLYGVLDDNGKFVENVAWDAPYARNENEFLDSIKYFLKRVKELAPDIHIVGNEGSLNDESRFPEVWADMAGSIREDICMDFTPDNYSRDKLFTTFKRYAWLGPAGKACLCRVLLKKDNDYANRLRTGYVAYLIFRGRNFFFGPRLDDGSSREAPPQDYADMKAAIGLPVGPAVSEKAANAPNDGYRLYLRGCEGGIVYMNWTGRPLTIMLGPAGRFYDHNGNAITHLTIPDMTGDYVLTIPDMPDDYVLTAPGLRTARPSINPRRGAAVTGPLAVTLETTTPDAVIRYTTDGTEPNASSPVYRRPIILTRSAKVKACAFVPGRLPSFPAVASYTVTALPPAVRFHLAADRGSAQLDTYYPLVELDHPSAKPVRVHYAVTGGTAKGDHSSYALSAGTLTFAPGETYQYFPLPILNNRRGNRTVHITLSAPVNAALGTRPTFTYTILTKD